ncbi:transcription intermediary factor 1-alpha [Exaiptasia diaphana]|uniref:B box-type domain-containing protein n=1 Tax=Exaiptasia diaphana TaxID=2652724 RepID=A0A913XYF1_EXADI|nr:transcription intermediary factor 1-alpha [Exaiptasia diaphana]KXJ08011.1 Transcription intermediary factor 1-alpha [Exaiptasia diaphana]
MSTTETHDCCHAYIPTVNNAWMILSKHREIRNRLHALNAEKLSSLVSPIGTGQLKANFQMNQLMSLLTISTREETKSKEEAKGPGLPCENCTSKDASKGRCFECCKFMCDFCLKTHQRFLETRDHKIMTLEEVKKQGAPAMTQQVKCEKHKGEVKKLYCESCQQLICRDCTIIDHRDHKFQFIDEVAGRHVKNLKSDIENATAVKDRIQQSLEEIKTTKFNINVTAVQMGKDVDKAIDQKIQSLEQQRKALKKEVEAKTNVKIGNLEKQENDILTKMKNLKSAIDFTENALQSTNVNILSLSSEAGSRLKSLTRIQFKGQPCEKDTLFFQDDDQKFQNILKSMMKVLENKNQYDAGHQPGRPGNYGYLRHYYGNE